MTQPATMTKKLVRNASTPAVRAFWEAAKRTAAGVAKWPAWMKAGIDISPRHYETYSPQPTTGGR